VPAFIDLIPVAGCLQLTEAPWRRVFLPLIEIRRSAPMSIRAFKAQGAPPVAPNRFTLICRGEIGMQARHLIARDTGEIIRRGIDNIHRFVISRANFSVWYA
jgi:hypothetical protein